MHAEASTPRRTVAFVTMGCAKNEVDSALMRARLLKAGYQVIEDASRADAVIVNTCSFIRAATEESIEAILDVAGFESVSSGRAHLVVSGCMPARYGDDLRGELSEAGAFVPCSEEDDIVSVMDSLFGSPLEAGAGESAEPFFAEAAPVSAYVKISDGCDRFCSFCSIPVIRGRYHSFPYERIRDDVADLVARGTREVVLIAQDTGRWGDDFDDPSTLASLMDRLAREFPGTWLRVMYIQPEGVTDELIDTVASHGNICNYFDIPFQHVDSNLLTRMNRRGSREEYHALIERVRTRIPDVALRTTLMAGFPGETDEQFEDLCAFVEDAELDYIGVFAYSREEGTRAFRFDDQVEDDEKAERAQRLRDLADSVCVPRVAERIGSVTDVLVCGAEQDGRLFGRAPFQAPDVDGVVYLEAGEVGEVRRIFLEDALLYELEGSDVQ